MKIIYIVLIVCLFALLLSMERVQEERSGYRAAALLEDVEFKKARNQYMRYKIGLYQSPKSVTEKASELGMRFTPPADIITIKEKK
jgi:hypothetical protein